LSWVLLIALALNLIAAALVLSFERDMPGSNINSYPDALWWAATTITTVGYGDRFPMSPAGRGVAVVLIVSGIALFGVITASIAAYFVEHNAEQDDLAGRLDRILERLDTIEAGLRVGEREDQRSKRLGKGALPWLLLAHIAVQRPLLNGELGKHLEASAQLHLGGCELVYALEVAGVGPLERGSGRGPEDDDLHLGMPPFGELPLEPLPGRAGALVLAELGELERSAGAVIDEEKVAHGPSVRGAVAL